MNNATKASLCSAFAFPGLGHLILKKYRLALPYLVVTIISSCVIMHEVIQVSQNAIMNLPDISTALQTPADIRAMTDKISLESRELDSFRFNISMDALMLCWIIALVDAFRLGRAEDLKTPKKLKPEIS